MQNQPSSLPKPVTEFWRPEWVALPRLTPARRIFRHFAQSMLWLISVLTMKSRVCGMENFPKKGPALVIINHLGDADAVLLGASIPYPIDALGKIELHQHPDCGRNISRLRGDLDPPRPARPEGTPSPRSRVSQRTGHCHGPGGTRIRHRRARGWQRGRSLYRTQIRRADRSHRHDRHREQPYLWTHETVKRARLHSRWENRSFSGSRPTAVHGCRKAPARSWKSWQICCRNPIEGNYKSLS